MGSISIRVTLADESLQLEVSDTGSGIPQELQSSVFKPYFSTKTRGTGMGLALTEKLVSQHGGNVTFQTGSQGTTFRIVLPLKQSNESV